MVATRVAVVGASGYAGEELVRLLLEHPQVDLAAVTSRQSAGKSVAEVFPRFAHHPKAQALAFSDPDFPGIAQLAEVAFLALPHGVSAEAGAELLKHRVRVIDLSADFRIRDAAVYKEFYGKDHPAPHLLKRAVYGLPEVYRQQIRGAELVASPGCYPTSILLPVLPLLRAGVIDLREMLVTSLSGVTGAGRKIEADYLFAECHESMRPYGVPRHRHLSEIEQELSIAAQEKVTIQFTPHLVPVNRGIISTIYLGLTKKIEAARVNAIYQEAYGEEPFVRLLAGDRLPDTKNVAQTNFIDIAWRLDERTGRLVVLSAIDNLTKGTSGQAVQCFNLMRGYPETTGLL
ncbi:MAG TPA: N-acetyl-gamma-glutamyl-phosphate reductase [Chthoniobacterales bacterium]